jgi:hypothetical protein
MSTGVALSGYIDSPILLRLAYRNNRETDNYDTSEKMRIRNTCVDRPVTFSPFV